VLKIDAPWKAGGRVSAGPGAAVEVKTDHADGPAHQAGCSKGRLPEKRRRFFGR